MIIVFLNLLSSRKEIHRVLLDTIPAVQVFKTDLYMDGLSPSSLYTQFYPVVVVGVSGLGGA